MEGQTVPQNPPDYGPIVATYLRTQFKDFATYTNFEISDPRWVNSTSGWNWLVCVRFDERQRRRIYAFFVRDKALADSRYAIRIDTCEEQHFVPFDVTSGAVGLPTPTLAPIH